MKKLQTIFFLSLLIMGNGTDSFAQKTMAMPEGGYEFCENAKSTVIPFKLIDNLIVISVELNGTPLNLILDSGMPFDGALLFGSEKVDATKLDFSAKNAGRWRGWQSDTIGCQPGKNPQNSESDPD
jgi:hypothetical protein